MGKFFQVSGLVELLSKLTPELHKDCPLIFLISNNRENSQHPSRVTTRGLYLVNRHCNWETQIKKFEQLLESLVSDR